jgi:D-sedoheptulose 7-phosphate isomerase
MERAQQHLRETMVVQQLVARQCLRGIVQAAELVRDAFLTGHKLLLCGNGGSAADCQHVAAEFVSRLRADLERPALPAVALTTDTSFLTAFANDCGFEGVFARQLMALGQQGDVLLAISTSGRSGNVLLALEAARRAGLRTIGLFGAGGSRCNSVDVAIAVPSRNTQVIQECMLSIEHALCELVEESLFGDLRPDLRGAVS